MVLSVEQQVVQEASEVNQVISSDGAVIQVTKLGGGVGMPLMTVACPDATLFLSPLSSPVYAMQLRGFAGSRIAR